MTATAGDDLPEADTVLFTSRLLAAERGTVFEAFSDPARLARWWGPEGFRNTFDVCEFRPGGAWKFTMHGPDGKDYPNESHFTETSLDRVVVRHDSEPHFTLTVTLEAMGLRTRMGWHQRFDSAETCRVVRKYAVPANEQNLDRLEQELGLR